MTQIRDALTPQIEADIEDVAPYDNVMWDIGYVLDGGTLRGVLVLTKPSPLIGQGIIGGTFLDDRRALADDNYRKGAVRAVIEGLREQEAAIVKSINPPNGHRP